MHVITVYSMDKDGTMWGHCVEGETVVDGKVMLVMYGGDRLIDPEEHYLTQKQCREAWEREQYIKAFHRQSMVVSVQESPREIDISHYGRFGIHQQTAILNGDVLTLEPCKKCDAEKSMSCQCGDPLAPNTAHSFIGGNCEQANPAPQSWRDLPPLL